MAERVLVTGAYARKCLAVVTSLGRRGIEVTAGNVDRWGPPLWSRWVSRTFTYPEPGADSGNALRAGRGSAPGPEGFLRAIEKELASREYDLIFPTGGGDTTVLARFRERFNVPIAAPPIELIELANDKEALLRRAEAAGVPIPRTYFDARTRVDEVRKTASYPVLVRPNSGSGGHGLVRVERGEDLAAAIERVHATYGSVLVQDFVPSAKKGFGCSLVLDSLHRPVAVFAHRRLREYPVGGGPATLVESVRDERLSAQARKLLEALHWTSVAMTEWRLDARDGEYRLIEINPRMWGSSHLALDAGVDFPWILWQVHRGKTTGLGGPEYREGLRRRWLMPADILHWMKNPDRRAMNPPFFRLFEKNTRYDFMEWSDPGPAVLNVLSLARMLLTGRAKQHIHRGA